MTNTGERRAHILNLLYDFHPERPDDMPDMATLLGGALDEQEKTQWRDTLRALAVLELIFLSESTTFEGTGALITDTGRAQVEQRRARASNPALRRAVAGSSLLSWLYDQGEQREGWAQIPNFLASVRAMFEGKPLSAELVGRVAEQLRDDGLIEGRDGPAEFPGVYFARITRQGQECVEQGGNVSDYLRQSRTAQPNITTNFYGDVSGSNVSWASSYVDQNVTTTTGVVGEELGVLLKAITEAVPALGLADADGKAVARNVAVLEGELQRPEPDKQLVRTMLMRTLDTIVGAGNSSLGLVITGYAKELMKSAGIPIE